VERLLPGLAGFTLDHLRVHCLRFVLAVLDDISPSRCLSARWEATSVSTQPARSGEVEDCRQVSTTCTGRFAPAENV
jgi:hypothetical protein